VYRFLLKIGAAVFCSVVAASMVGCGGVSTGSSEHTTPPPPPAAMVQLSWHASTSSGVAGYNVYRSLYTNACGSFSRINTQLETTTSYSDSQVSAGSSYCYATTAVNSNNQESAYSNVVLNVQIPTS
jgi:fibronectin type 3 domain-containing protein